MCTHPIEIGNRSRHYKSGVSPTSFVVPCGHCRECQINNQNEWFVRAFFEHRRVSLIGGCTYFLLLTLAPKNVDYFEDEMPDEDGVLQPFRIPVFNYLYIKRFRDKLRTYITRSMGKEFAQKIRYFIAPEYGEQTGWPHFHLLLHVPFVHEQSLFIGRSTDTRTIGKGSSAIVVKAPFSQGFIPRAWKYGHVFHGKNHPCVIESFQGIKYAMKYLDKDSLWIKKYNIPEYKQYLRSLVKDMVETDPHYIKYRDFCRLLPRHRQSMGYGVDGLNELFKLDGNIDIDLLKQGFNLSQFGFLSDMDNKFYKIPKYYINKALYEPARDGSLQLSLDGIDVKRKLFEDNLKSLKSSYETILANFKEYSALVPSEEAKKFLDSYSLDTWLDFRVSLLDRSINTSLLALYALAYRSVCIDDYQFLFTRDYNFQLNYLKDNAIYVYSSRLAQPLWFDKNCSPYYTDSKFRVRKPDFSEFKPFFGFRRLLDRLEDFQRLYGKYVNLKKVQEKNTIDKLKQEFAPAKYVSLNNLHRL